MDRNSHPEVFSKAADDKNFLEFTIEPTWVYVL